MKIIEVCSKCKIQEEMSEKDVVDKGRKLPDGWRFVTRPEIFDYDSFRCVFCRDCFKEYEKRLANLIDGFIK